MLHWEVDEDTCVLSLDQEKAVKRLIKHCRALLAKAAGFEGAKTQTKRKRAPGKGMEHVRQAEMLLAVSLAEENEKEGLTSLLMGVFAWNALKGIGNEHSKEV